MEYNLEKQTYEKAEVQALLDKFTQSEADRVRTEYSRKLKAVESERDALKPAEKTEQEKALEQREAELNRKERVFACKTAGVDPAFADLLRDDADLSKLGELLKDGKGYQPGNHNGSTAMSRAEFEALPYSKQAELYTQNPKIFETLV